MHLSLRSTNHDKEHQFTLIVRDKELIFTTPDGDEICCITAQTMEREDRLNDEQPCSSCGEESPDLCADDSRSTTCRSCGISLKQVQTTPNFWLVFDAPGSQLDKNLAEAIVEEIEEPAN